MNTQRKSVSARHALWLLVATACAGADPALIESTRAANEPAPDPASHEAPSPSTDAGREAAAAPGSENDVADSGGNVTAAEPESDLEPEPDPALDGIPDGMRDMAYMGPVRVIERVIGRNPATALAVPAPGGEPRRAIVTGVHYWTARCEVVVEEYTQTREYWFAIWDHLDNVVRVGLERDRSAETAAFVDLCESTPDKTLSGTLMALYFEDRDQRIAAVNVSTSAEAYGCAEAVMHLRRDVLWHQPLSAAEPLGIAYSVEQWTPPDILTLTPGAPYDSYLISESPCQVEESSL